MSEPKEKKKCLKFNAVAAAILYLALGVVLLVWPDVTSNIICYAIGAVLLIYGAINIISFLTSKEKTASAVLQIIVGVVVAALGVFCLSQPVFMLSILPILMGLFIIIVSLLSLKRALELRRRQYPKWWIALIMSLAAIALGVLIVFHPYMTQAVVVMLIGVVLLYVGVSDLWAIWKNSRSAKELRKNNPVTVDPIDID